MKWRQIIDDYFRFSFKERLAVILLALVLLFIVAIPRIFPRKEILSAIQPADTSWIKAANTNEPGKPGYEAPDNSYQYEPSATSYFNKEKATLFSFDPNTLPAGGWRKLGLREKTIRTIQNYLARGGHFYKPEDLSKIYGLSKEDYERLAPYIRLDKPDDRPAYTTTTYTAAKSEMKTERNRSLDINLADTTAFIALPGIGSKLAARIVNFRDKLGGFYSVDQVKETFGLPDSTFQKIKPLLLQGNAVVRKININTATIEELKAHPYIRYNLANPIMAYRNQHGSFSTIEDIKKVMVVTDEIYAKLSPYLTTQ